MPHIYAEQTDDNLELPYTNGDFSIHNYLKNSRYGLFLVEQDGFGFVLATKNKGGKHLIKYDKPTRPASTAVLTKALQNLASALNATGISSNIAAEQKTSDHANPKVLKPDFFMQNPDFLNNKSAELEVGFGSGRHLIAIAQKHPEKIFFGVEIYKPAVAQMLGRMTHENLDNIYIVDFDARLFLQTMPSDSLDKIHIHFPVPWNDAPHRRVFVKKFVDESFRVLNQNGKLELRSDDDIYFQDACKLVLSYEQADLHIYKNRDILVSSKYEDRWKKQGKDIYDLTISALKNVNNSNFEYNFDFDKPINIEVAQQLSSGTTTVFDGILVKFEDILIAKDGSFLLKVVLGSVDMPESKYIYSADGRSYFYPSKPLAILDNLRAFNKLKEMVYG